MRRAFRILTVVLTVLVTFVARSAFAAAPELRTQIDADTVAIGEELRLSLQAMSADDPPTDPKPGSLKGFTLRGTSSMPSTSISIVNGIRTDKRGVVVTWILRADRVGMFTIGPPSVVVGSKRYKGQPVRINVVAAGQGRPQRTQGGTVNPFDPWKGLLQLDLGGDEPPRAPDADADPKLSLDVPRAPGVFLHAVADKTRAVVGEQITLSVLLYVDATEREPDFHDVHEATAADFVKRSLLDGDQARALGVAMAGGRPWHVKLVRKWALFPLKSGELTIDPMELALPTDRGSGTKRQSEPLVIRVSEPPMDGRPAGYTIGDVGKFSLAAEVTPHEIERGGAVGVTVDLSGLGNLPAQLNVPLRAGLEWLPPEVHEKVGAVNGGDRFGGKRTFSYVLRASKAGDIDLGSLELPYWDPDAKQYSVARARLGSIKVTPGSQPAAQDRGSDVLPGLPAARSELGPPRAPARYLSDSSLPWLFLGASPLAWVFFAGARAAGKRLRARSVARAVDPTTEMKARIAEAETASKNLDASATDGAVVRALESTTIACIGVNLRGTTGDATERELANAGFDGSEARELVTLYRACQSSRFSPETSSAIDARQRWVQARELIKALERAKGAGA